MNIVSTIKVFLVAVPIQFPYTRNNEDRTHIKGIRHHPDTRSGCHWRAIGFVQFGPGSHSGLLSKPYGRRERVYQDRVNGRGMGYTLYWLNTMNYLNIALLAILILVLLLVSPIFTIWALNTLFPVLAIPMNIWTWLAVIWLHIVIGSASYSKKS